MKMYEYLGIAKRFSYPAPDELIRADHVYQNYVRRYRKAYGDDASPVSFAVFLLTDVGYEGYDAFTWDEGVLVRVKADGTIGLTCGWSLVGCTKSHYEVSVRTARGEVCYKPDAIEKADIPPEVLEYVKSTLRPAVQAKVDEAFS